LHISELMRNFAGEYIVTFMEHIDNISEPVAGYGINTNNQPGIAETEILPDGCITVEQYFDTLRSMIKEGYANL